MVKPVLCELSALHQHLSCAESWIPPEDIAQQLLTAWERICHRVTQTTTTEKLQDIREDYRATLLGYLQVLEGYISVMIRFRDDDSRSETLNRLIENKCRLQKHCDSLFPRWQSLEDLESILLERISLPNEQLKELAAKYPPSAAWYNQVDDQLTLE